MFLHTTFCHDSPPLIVHTQVFPQARTGTHKGDVCVHGQDAQFVHTKGMYVCAGSIVGIALGIICVLFLIQRFGTRVVGSAFSPVILLWLLFNAMIGIYNLHTYGAGVFRAFGPNYWFAYLLRNGHQGWKSLGGVVLCITGTAVQQCFCHVFSACTHLRH